jgi:hypothetical protein
MSDQLTSDDLKWIELIRQELFWSLDRAVTAEAQRNKNARIDALDKLLRIATGKQ